MSVHGCRHTDCDIDWRDSRNCIYSGAEWSTHLGPEPQTVIRTRNNIATQLKGVFGSTILFRSILFDIYLMCVNVGQILDLDMDTNLF